MSKGMKRQLTITFEEARARLPEALAAEGFGVLSEIDVRATLERKLGKDIGDYRIFGACNPALAYRALSHDRAIGTMLPCNVVLHGNEGGGATVIAVDPLETVAASDPELAPVAQEVRERLERVVDAMGRARPPGSAG